MPTGLHYPALIKALIAGAFFIFAAAADIARAGEQPAVVTAAVDGDTVLLQGGRLVRLLAINTPELGKDGGADEPLARAAQSALDRMVAGQPVRLVTEDEAHDRYGRTLARVILPDGRDVAEALLAQGLACAIAIPPNTARSADYFRIEARARVARRGLWADPYYVPLPAERLSSSLTGFRFIKGKVRRVSGSRHGQHLWLSDTFALFVPHADVHRFPGRLRDLAGRAVEARGWVTARDGRLRMKIQHPSMLRMDGGAGARENHYHLTSSLKPAYP